MSQTQLFLVRHGQTDYNLKHIVQGRGVNTDLNETGSKQAAALANRFSTIDLDVIYSSPLNRAMQTAKAVLERKGDMPFHTDVDLEEMSWGVHEGKPTGHELSDVFEEMRSRWGAGEYDFALEGGESITEVQTRGIAAIDRIVDKHLGQSVLVVTHGRFLRVILASLLTEYGLKRMEELTHSNTGVNHLVSDDGKNWQLKTLDCVQHLETENTAER